MEHLSLKEASDPWLMADKGGSISEDFQFLVVEGRCLVAVFCIGLLLSCAQVKRHRGNGSMFHLMHEFQLLEV